MAPGGQSGPDADRPLPTRPCSNGSGQTFIAAPRALLASLVEALGIACNTATMCDEPRGKAPFEALRPQVAALAPMMARSC